MTGPVTLQLPQWLREQRPEATDQLQRAYETAVALSDPRLLELVRLRIGMLIGNDPVLQRAPWVSAEVLPDATIARLSRWPDDAAFSERERDTLAFTEQFVMDVAGVSDSDAHAVHRHFDASAFYALVTAIFVMEYAQRLCLAARLLGDPAGAVRSVQT